MLLPAVRFSQRISINPKFLPTASTFGTITNLNNRVNHHHYYHTTTRTTRLSSTTTTTNTPKMPLIPPSTARSGAPSDTRPVVISGPSGVGKGTLFKMLFAAHPDTFALSVSHTTRGPRGGEADGVDYHFTTMSNFEDLIAQDAFVEHAKFGSNRYGTSKQTITEQTAKGQVVVLDIEMEGVKQIKNSGMDCRFVFVAPPAFEDLEKRLRGRGTETDESIEKRLAQAKKELEYAQTPGVHDRIIVNDDLGKAYQELEDYVYATAE